MKLDIDKYRVNFEPLVNYMKRKDLRTMSEIKFELSQFSATTMVPVICCYHYYMEAFGEQPELMEVLDNLYEFYQLERE